jgi:hypothetical protein
MAGASVKRPAGGAVGDLTIRLESQVNIHDLERSEGLRIVSIGVIPDSQQPIGRLTFTR